jgi:hypothetical protein
MDELGWYKRWQIADSAAVPRKGCQQAMERHLSGHSSSELIGFLAVFIQQVVHAHCPIWPFSLVNLQQLPDVTCIVIAMLMIDS